MARLIGQGVTRFVESSGGPELNLPAAVFITNTGFGGIVEGELELQFDGDLLATQFGGLQGIFDAWILQSGKPLTSAVGGLYECRLERTSGTNPGGLALNFWYSLGSTRTWTWTQAGIGILSFGGTLRVRKIGDAGSEVSCGVNVTLENGV